MSQTHRALSTRLRNGLEEIAASHGFTLDQLIAKGKFKPQVEARWACWKYLADNGWATTHIACLFNRDHSSVVYAFSWRLEERRAHQREYRRARKRDPWDKPLGARRVG